MALGVLVVALACLVVGLVLTSSAWLIASLAASAVAGLVLWRDRAQRGRADRAQGGRAAPPERPASLARGTSSSGTSSSGTSSSGTSSSGTASSGIASSGTSSSDAAPDEVWVVDGRPRYHRAGCLILKGQDAEPIPRAQADEDGFIPCSMCEPDRPRR